MKSLALFRILLATLCPLIAAVSCSGLSSRSAGGQPAVHFAGTPGYERKAATFRISLEQARTRVAQHIRSASGGSDTSPAFSGAHAVIVGECYHFFLPRKDGGIPWAGYYVDGHSGEVLFRAQPGTI
jgi:hypothetical protein